MRRAQLAAALLVLVIAPLSSLAAAPFDIAARSALTALPPSSFDCAFRQFVLEHARTLQPWRAPALWSAMADALNGAVEAQNCSVALRDELPAASHSRFVHRAVPAAGAPATFYIDALRGSDAAAGTLAAPFLTLTRGLAATRAAAPTPGTLVLRGGTFYLPAPLELDGRDSGLTVQAFAGEDAWLSGGQLLTGVAWAPYNTSAGGAWSAQFQDTNDVLAAQPGAHIRILPSTVSADACEAACKAAAAWGCNAWTWHDTHQGSYSLDCYLRNDGVWHPVSQSGHVSGYSSPPLNVWVARIDGLAAAAVTGLRHADGSRATRARYPNGAPEAEGFSSSLYADGWLCNNCGSNTLQPDYQFTDLSVLRNTTAAGWFQHPQAGVGGHCDAFDPPAGYWCGNETMGGGAFTYRAPYAMLASLKTLPHMPYANATGAIVQTWRPGHWSSWMFEVANVSYDTSSGNATFVFSKGGFQGGRGANEGGEIYIEGVLEELDAPDEWHWDAASSSLYWYFNTSTIPSPPPAEVVVTNLQSLVRIVGTPAAPVTGVTFAGVGFRDTAYSYMEKHGA